MHKCIYGVQPLQIVECVERTIAFQYNPAMEAFEYCIYYTLYMYICLKYRPSTPHVYYIAIIVVVCRSGWDI